MDRVDMEATKQEKAVSVAKSASLADVFRSRVICVRTLNMCYQVTTNIGAYRDHKRGSLNYPRNA